LDTDGVALRLGVLDGLSVIDGVNEDDKDIVGVPEGENVMDGVNEVDAVIDGDTDGLTETLGDLDDDADTDVDGLTDVDVVLEIDDEGDILGVGDGVLAITTAQSGSDERLAIPILPASSANPSTVQIISPF